MRVTIIGLNYAPETTGNAPYTASLAEGLAGAGHEVTVITGYPHYPEWQLRPGYAGWSRREEINGVSVRRLRHFIPRKPNALSRIHMEVSFGVRVLFTSWKRPDIVLLVSPALLASGLAAVRARLSRRRPGLGIWVQDIYCRGIVETASASGGIAQIAARLEAAIIGAADGVVVIHDRFREFLVTSLSVSASKVRVIRNWTHLPESPHVQRDQIRERLGWSPDEIIVLHAGNMGRKQGLENVIAAARISQERERNVRFVLLGDGNQRESLESLAVGVNKVDFLNPLPENDFQQALASADLLLVNELPGVKDMSVPSKLTSYFNAGVAVIAATDEGSVTAAEIAISGAGVRVDAASPGQLVQKAEELSKMPQALQEMGRRGLRFRHETLSEAAAIALYDEFVSSLATSRSR